MSPFDRLSEVMVFVVRLLLVNYQWHTGIGVLLGGLFASAARALRPALQQLLYIDLTAVPLYGWVCLGLLITHSLLLPGKLRQQPLGEAAIDRILEVIERANFTETERRQAYRLLISSMAKDISISKNIAPGQEKEDTP